jgi:hypothetical protein
MKRLWLMQATGNALLFWCVFTWLGIRDSRPAQLMETAILGLLILIPWLWLQDGAFVYCGDRSQGLWGAYRRGAKTLVIFSAIVIAFVLLFWALGRLEGPLATGGQRTASWLTFHLRKPVKPASWARGYVALLWCVRWIVLPVVMLPIAAGAAMDGTRGIWRRAGRVFWVEYVIALVAGFYVPSLLIHWVPRLTGTSAQVASFVLRIGIAYVLMITAWLAVAFFSASRSTFAAKGAG